MNDEKKQADTVEAAPAAARDDAATPGAPARSRWSMLKLRSGLRAGSFPFAPVR